MSQYALNLPNLVDNYYIRGLNMRDVDGAVIYKDERYSMISMLSDKFSKAKYSRVRTPEFGSIGNLGVTQQVSTTSANPSNSTWLDVYFSDSTFNQFRKGDVLRSSSEATGWVQFTTPGKATVMPLSNGSGTALAAFTASDFTTGTYASLLYNSSADQWSDATPTRNYEPVLDNFFLGMTRWDGGMSREEIVQATYPRFDTETNMWSYGQQIIGVREFKRSLETRILVGDGVRKGGTTVPLGVIPTLRKKGQRIIMPNLNNVLTYVNAMMEQLTRTGGSNTDHWIVLCGSAFMGLLQSQGFAPFVTTAGKNTTLKVNGQDIVGINCTEWGYLTKRVSFVLYPALDDPAVFPDASTIPGANGKPKMSFTALFLDPSPANTSLGQEAAFQKYIFGPEGTPEFGSYVINGLVGGMSAAGGIMGDPGTGYNPAQNAKDGMQYGIWFDGGIKISIPEYNGIIELPS